MKWPTWDRTLRLAAVVLAGALLVGCGRAPLYSQLDEQQANELMAALLDSGIQADKAPSPSKTGWEIRVGRSDFPYAMQVLRSRGLPRAQYASLGEIFKKEGFASSAVEEKARYIYGLQQELARTLSLMPGVVDARVHIALPDRDPLGGDTIDSSAAVMIYEQAGANVRDRETDIKVLIKDSVEGLDDVNKVTVKFATVAAASNTRAGTAGGAMPMSLSSISPLGLGLAAGVIALIVLAIAFFGRMRARYAQAKQPQPRVWNG
jgi:type III secretion protein J